MTLFSTVLGMLRKEFKILSTVRMNGMYVAVTCVDRSHSTFADRDFPDRRFHVQVGGLTCAEVDVNKGDSIGTELVKVSVQRYKPDRKTDVSKAVGKRQHFGVAALDKHCMIEDIMGAIVRHVRAVGGLPIATGNKFPFRWAITLVSTDIRAAKDALQELVRDIDQNPRATNCNGSEKYSLAARWCPPKVKA